MLIRCIVAEDEAPARRRLRALLESRSDVEVVAECRSGRELKGALARYRPDLALVDIEMPGTSGMDALHGSAERPLVIFTTAYEDYAVEAFGIDALDYLLKPYSDARFHEAIARARDRLRRYRPGSRLAVQLRDRTVFVPLAEIERIEAARDYVRIHTARRPYMLRSTMSAIADRLPPDFIRIRRSTIVRSDLVRELRTDGGDATLVMEDGTRIRVGSTYRERVAQTLGI